MAKFSESLSDFDIEFIKNQKIFFVSTAPKSGKINLSPKGLDNTFKIVDKNRVLWLNYLGSGNETASHLLEDNRMTLMFCAFDGSPKILRLYCIAEAIQERDENWNEYIKEFPDTKGARQVFDVQIESVNSSCGMGVPLYNYIDQRKSLPKYYNRSSKEELVKYMKDNNQISFDGKESKLFKK